MPRYYFDLHKDVDALDPEGKELPDLAAARAQAVVEAKSMLEDSAGKGRINLNHFIEIRDDAGNHLHRLHFGDIVTIIPRAAE